MLPRFPKGVYAYACLWASGWFSLSDEVFLGLWIASTGLSSAEVHHPQLPTTWLDGSWHTPSTCLYKIWPTPPAAWRAPYVGASVTST